MFAVTVRFSTMLNNAADQLDMTLISIHAALTNCIQVRKLVVMMLDTIHHMMSVVQEKSMHTHLHAVGRKDTILARTPAAWDSFIVGHIYPVVADSRTTQHLMCVVADMSTRERPNAVAM